MRKKSYSTLPGGTNEKSKQYPLKRYKGISQSHVDIENMLEPPSEESLKEEIKKMSFKIARKFLAQNITLGNPETDSVFTWLRNLDEKDNFIEDLVSKIKVPGGMFPDQHEKAVREALGRKLEEFSKRALSKTKWNILAERFIEEKEKTSAVKVACGHHCGKCPNCNKNMHILDRNRCQCKSCKHVNTDYKITPKVLEAPSDISTGD
jgi:hypothetical protein